MQKNLDKSLKKVDLEYNNQMFKLVSEIRDQWEKRRIVLFFGFIQHYENLETLSHFKLVLEF